MTNKSMTEKDKKQRQQDDGHTVADMNVPGMPWYMDKKYKQSKKNIYGIELTRRERWALVRGILSVVVPIGLLFVGAYAIFMLLLQWLWLK